MKKQSLICALLLALVFPALVVGQGRTKSKTADPLVGTWELSIAKSKYNPGPAPKSETRTYVVAGQNIKATSKGVDADGKPTSGQWTVNYDGKDRPATGSPDADALSLKRIDAFTAEFTRKKAGKVVATGTRVISKDGKVMTITTKGTNAKGQAFNDVEVFDKR
jgi:hypothetical protein